MQTLLIIDIQNDYFPGGRAELVGPEAALANAECVLRRFRDKNWPIIHVQHINVREGATFFLPGTAGAEIHERLTPRSGEQLVVKNSPNAFYRTDLLDIIRRAPISELVVCGMMTHMCIDTTVRAAKDYELPVTLVSDACATKDLSFEGAAVPAAMVQTAYLAALSGTFARTISAAEFAQQTAG